jgi:hypothetical protein
VCVIDGPLNIWETTKSFETLHYCVHLISKWSNDELPKNNVDDHVNMTSLKISETINQPTTNNSSQVKRLQPCAILYKAQVIHTSIGINNLLHVSCFELEASNDQQWQTKSPLTSFGKFGANTNYNIHNNMENQLSTLISFSDGTL